MLYDILTLSKPSTVAADHFVAFPLFTCVSASDHATFLTYPIDLSLTCLLTD